MTTITDDITEWERQQAATNHRTVPDEQEGERVEESSERLTEHPPRIPTPTLGKGLRNLRDRAAKLREKSPAASRGRPRTVKARVAVDKLIGHAWGFLARMVAPVSLPMAKVMEVQAPVAGMVLEDIVKDTIVDKVLQPIARVEGQGEVVFALLGPPLLVGAISKRPDMARVLVPMLRESLRTWITIAGPKMERVMKQEQEFTDRYGVQIDQMIAYFLAGIEGLEMGPDVVTSNEAGNG